MQPWLLYRKPAQLLGLLSPLFGKVTGCIVGLGWQFGRSYLRVNRRPTPLFSTTRGLPATPITRRQASRSPNIPQVFRVQHRANGVFTPGPGAILQMATWGIHPVSLVAIGAIMNYILVVKGRPHTCIPLGCPVSWPRQGQTLTSRLGRLMPEFCVWAD